MYINLTEAIQSRGVKKAFIAEKLGISVTTLDNKLAGRTRFYVEEAFQVAQILNLNEAKLNFYFAQSE